MRRLVHPLTRSSHRALLALLCGCLACSIASAQSSALTLWDSQMRRVDINTAYERMYGWTREDVIGKGYEQLPFGAEDYLYVGSGDGGSAGDPGNRAQNKDTLFGKILRLDVVGQATYAAPADNPFVGVAGDDRVWSYGLRNPWRFSFDSWGAIYIGDVGQNAWEEVDVAASGGRGLNYGWKRWEGNHPYPPGSPSPGRAG